MEAKCEITLSESEMKMAIAKALNVEQEDVRLVVGHVVVGVGPMEREEHHVHARLKVPFRMSGGTIEFGKGR